MLQESNTFAPGRCRWSDFTVVFDEQAEIFVRGTNSEMAGALAELSAAGAEPHPLVFAWAMPSAPVDHDDYLALRDELLNRLDGARWDAVVLSLHGAMATTLEADADGALAAAIRAAIGDVPLVMCLDLHANVTRRMVGASDAIIGYHTDPHVDQADTGRRAARLALAVIEGRVRPVTAMAKRPMLMPAEAMNTTSGPLGAVRRHWDTALPNAVLDLSLFPVQPWLDVPELGFGVLVTTDGDGSLAESAAESVADEAYRLRESFAVDLVDPEGAIVAARRSSIRPFIVSHSADAPTAGAAGDNPAMIRALVTAAPDLRALVPIVDAPAVGSAHRSGAGAALELEIGASIDDRWEPPFSVVATVERVGDDPYILRGASYTGMKVSMGRFAVLAAQELRILVTERPAWSADPAAFLHAGLDPAGADLVVVRSCSDFRPNYPTSAGAVTLDVPGPATPNLRSLTFERAPRPLWPLDPV